MTARAGCERKLGKWAVGDAGPYGVVPASSSGGGLLPSFYLSFIRSTGALFSCRLQIS